MRPSFRAWSHDGDSFPGRPGGQEHGGPVSRPWLLLHTPCFAAGSMNSRGPAPNGHRSAPGAPGPGAPQPGATPAPERAGSGLAGGPGQPIPARRACGGSPFRTLTARPGHAGGAAGVPGAWRSFTSLLPSSPHSPSLSLSTSIQPVCACPSSSLVIRFIAWIPPLLSLGFVPDQSLLCYKALPLPPHLSVALPTRSPSNPLS